jgi:hypothetical protein
MATTGREDIRPVYRQSLVGHYEPIGSAGMRIGIVATRLFGVDGVTFEAAKWEHVLERMGHEVRLMAGEVDPLRPTAKLVPPMHFT